MRQIATAMVNNRMLNSIVLNTRKKCNIIAVRSVHTNNIKEEHMHLLSNISTIFMNNNDLRSQEIKSAMQKYWNLRDNQSYKIKDFSILKSIGMTQYIQFIGTWFHSSSILRMVFYRELIYHSKDSIDVCNHIVRSWEQNIDKNQHAGNKIFKTQFDVFNYCIDSSLGRKDIVIAYDLYILYYKLFPNEPLDERIAKTLVTTITYLNPRFDDIYLMKFLQLLNLYEERKIALKLNRYQISSLSNKTLANKDMILVNKIILEKLMKIDIEDSPDQATTVNDRLTIACNLIKYDYSIKNGAGVYRTWEEIRGMKVNINHIDSRIIYRVLEIASRNKKYRSLGVDIIKNLSPSVYCNDQLILPSIINFATRTKNLKLIEQIMKKINQKLHPDNFTLVLQSKRCLSTLLRMHLVFNDSDGVDNVLKQIKEIFKEPDEEHYQAIITHLVKENSKMGFQKALNLVYSVPVSKSLNSSSTIIDHLLQTSLFKNTGTMNNHVLNIISKLISRAHEADIHHNHSFWETIASIYIKNILKAYSLNTKKLTTDLDNLNQIDMLGLAKLIYQNSSQMKKKNWDDISFNPFASLSPTDIKLKITKKNREVILKNISLVASRYERFDICHWCSSELYIHGMTQEDLKLELNLTINKKFREKNLITTKNTKRL
ncbi:hypothetical protein TPHA_0B04100 [Tetrapisispora phaffii CBS 4417]|uniref:Uncharacterized protein n=1 Tax=Tetrapisispora phaffii (strain ATCC 24235 / CBS 4417 / NBRC 1672 / NRRL Y-8282 / UCD 70-5) TaxID=1071381 RepID=G8BQ00_TETPH|nr:hypothetical protein TPHA_0B04100 [Tetrapisispora phaffii CBS 4417]CCE62081.1 hypothetical protein TPHA_0B04100 [Tetrapisispora phaffii CBS 4417]